MPPLVIAIIGLSSSGKTTLGRRLHQALARPGKSPVELIDGDRIREFLSGAIDYTPEGRKLSASVQTLLAYSLYQHGVSSIVCNISPFEGSRQFARTKIANFLEVYLDCPLQTCMERDRRLGKHVYQVPAGAEGRRVNVVGLDIPFEPPTRAELVLHTGVETEDECFAKLMEFVKRHWNRQPLPEVRVPSCSGEQRA